MQRHDEQRVYECAEAAPMIPQPQSLAPLAMQKMTPQWLARRIEQIHLRFGGAFTHP
jgi:hypothetical protein